MDTDEGQQKRFYAVRTTIGQEKNAATMIYSRLGKMDLGIQSILVTPELRGYIVIEADDATEIEKVLPGISHIRGIVEGNMEIGEIEKFLEPVSAVAKVNLGDIVEFTSGPFKGSRARVTKVDEAKEEITVVLFEATVPIPVTVSGSDIRVVVKED
ncbi:MAG: transcription elongation factor Spt5 [Methanobacteriota archaeon]|nr:MAG: transcription elongation factor Spt5 [Euryarchaeota archaeon]